MLPCVIAVFPATASPAEVSFTGQCPSTVEVRRYKPIDGPIARYAATAVVNSKQTSVWIGLGHTDDGYWSVEAADASDACDSCQVVKLVETKWDGKRKGHLLWDAAAANADPTKKKETILNALFRLAAKKWPADKLVHDESLSVGKAPAGANKDPSFAAKVSVEGKGEVRYRLSGTTSMCWCFWDWRSSGKPAVAPSAE